MKGLNIIPYKPNTPLIFHGIAGSDKGSLSGRALSIPLPPLHRSMSRSKLFDTRSKIINFFNI
jgi:hypothetical protein